MGGFFDNMKRQSNPNWKPSTYEKRQMQEHHRAAEKGREWIRKHPPPKKHSLLYG